MKRAVDNNMFVVTHIHLDDGLQKGTWRNAMIFNPNQKYGAMTFWEAVGKPTALAIKDANYKKRDVYYAMQVCAVRVTSKGTWCCACYCSWQFWARCAWLMHLQPASVCRLHQLTGLSTCTQHCGSRYWMRIAPAGTSLCSSTCPHAAAAAAQAEMGATLFYHPVAWRSIYSSVKSIIAQGGTPRNKVKVGININWEKVCGCPSDLIYSTNYFTVSCR
jgi:hypothetical protein